MRYIRCKINGLAMTLHYIERVPLNVLAEVPKKPVGRARKRFMDTVNLTFDNLKDLMCQRINRGDGPSPSSLSNLHSALAGFIQERQFAGAHPISSTLRASYYINVRAHSESLRQEGRTKEYIANRRILLSQWRKCTLDFDRYCAIQLKKAHPFQQAMQDILAKGFTKKGLARDSGISLATFKRWCNGSLPNSSTIAQVAKLERLLGLEVGALGDLLPTRLLQAEKAERQSAAPIAYRARLSAASQSPYAIKNANERLRREWSDYLQYKVSELRAVESLEDDDIEEEVGLARSTNGRWSSTNAKVAVQTTANWYAFYRGRFVATASIRWGAVSQFIGWLMLDENAGGKAMSSTEAHTLAHLSSRLLMREYVEWRTERAGGIVHGGIFDFLRFVSGLCNPRTGYLTQCGRQVAGAESPEQLTRWRTRCSNTFESARKLRDELSGDQSFSRHPLEPIQHVLALPNPLDAIADMVLRMSAAKPFTGGSREAVWARDKMLVKLLASNPLRDKNIRMLTYRTDNQGHLRQNEHGAWFIFVPRRELKNLKGAAKDRDYMMSVRPEVWADIEEYIRTFRPMLLKEATDRVFISEQTGGPFSQHGLARRFATLTKKYLHKCPGVGPHAVRHIVATSILKAAPNDWAAAAWALHDREETVKKHYAHLEQHDAAQWLNKSFEGPFGRMR